MDNYICKVATFDELNRRWEDLIKMHPGDDSWKEYKKHTFEYLKNGSAIPYLGFLGEEIICECYAHIDKNCGYIQNENEELINDKRAYTNAYRCNKEYEGKGYFSKLFHFMEDDLKKRGYESISVGVEPCDVRNIQIYFHFGFTNYIKTEEDTLLPEHTGDEPIKVYVNYYYKEL